MKSVTAYYAATVQAPALHRGLALLRLLNERGSLSLEEISRSVRVPKASCLRLLSVLMQNHIVERGDDKRYRALYRLAPNVGGEKLFEARLSSAMVALSEKLDCTVEWYEESAVGMVLREQRFPQGEVRVVARPGFVRKWGDELDSVAMLGYGYGAKAGRSRPNNAYLENGKRKSLSAKIAKASIGSAKKSGAAFDFAYNGNGVRRCAVALNDATGFRGVLALAISFRFDAEAFPGRYQEALDLTAKQII